MHIPSDIHQFTDGTSISYQCVVETTCNLDYNGRVDEWEREEGSIEGREDEREDD